MKSNKIMKIAFSRVYDLGFHSCLRKKAEFGGYK
jgi:hypothetical protein